MRDIWTERAVCTCCSSSSACAHSLFGMRHPLPLLRMRRVLPFLFLLLLGRRKRGLRPIQEEMNVNYSRKARVASDIHSLPSIRLPTPALHLSDTSEILPSEPLQSCPPSLFIDNKSSASPSSLLLLLHALEASPFWGLGLSTCHPAPLFTRARCSSSPSPLLLLLLQ